MNIITMEVPSVSRYSTYLATPLKSRTPKTAPKALRLHQYPKTLRAPLGVREKQTSHL